jgi:two-component system, cell cycle sensor histidine kinase and response regulator CckA
MSRPLHILIIEDNPDDRALIQRELKREYADLQMTPILNGTDFARALKEDEPFDLVLTDYQLPWTNGLAILHTVKNRYPDCPVIMVTGTGSEEIAVEAMKAGLDDYVIQPPQDCKIFGRLSVAVRTVLERAHERQALRKSEDRFHAFMDNSPAVAFMKDEDGRFIYVNQRFERFFKLTRQQWLGKTDFDLWPEETARQLRANDEVILAEDKPAEIFEAFPGPDGTLHYWLVFKFPVKDQTGRRFLGGMAVDITERRQLEQQLRQAQKMEAIGNLAGGVAHDFNNIVTIITGYSDMLLSRIGPEGPMRRELEQIKKAGDRAHSLTRQLLAFSRRQMLQPKVLDLNAVVTNLEPMLQRLIGENIDLVIELKPELGQVKADPGQVEQVIMNLAINGRDAMPQGGKLLLETDNAELDEAYARRHLPMPPGSYVHLAVSDTGHGMDAATQARIFEPFFTTKEQGKGTGLGLSTVYGIVKQSGGYIWVSSERGQGTTFKIYLPRVVAPADSVPPDTHWSSLPQGMETVLLVEDEPEVRWLVRDMLRHLGYTVLEARHGIEAQVQSIQHPGPIHLLITDVVMPQMSGRQIAERLTPEHPETKVLYMSGYTDDAVVRHGVLAAHMAFLQKPFSPEALALKVREVLDGQTSGSGSGRREQQGL